MTIQEAFKIIKNTSPCWDCKYKSSSCNREAAHVWTDGSCHEFDEALEVISAVIPNEESTEIEP